MRVNDSEMSTKMYTVGDEYTSFPQSWRHIRCRSCLNSVWTWTCESCCDTRPQLNSLFNSNRSRYALGFERVTSMRQCLSKRTLSGTLMRFESHRWNRVKIKTGRRPTETERNFYTRLMYVGTVTPSGGSRIFKRGRLVERRGQKVEFRATNRSRTL